MYAAADIMSVQALLRLLEAVTKSIKHAMAMSTILATEIFQARRDAVLATTKVLLENSNHELRNAPVNSKTLKIIIKLRKLPRAILRPSSKGSWQLPQLLIQYNNNKQQKVTYSAPPAFKKLKQLAKPSRPQQTQLFRPSHIHQIERNMLREMGIRNSSSRLSKPHPPQNIDVQPFPLPALPRPDIPVGGRLAHFVEQWEKLTDNKWVLSVVRNGFKIPFKSIPPLSVVPIKLSQSSSPLLREEIAELLKKRAVERVRNLGTPGFIPGYS